MQTVPELQPCNRTAPAASLAQAAADGVREVSSDPCPQRALSCSALPRLLAQSRLCARGLTSPEQPPLTKVLSLLYWICSRVNKITHLQPNEAHVLTTPLLAHPSAPRGPHTGQQPRFAPGELLCRGQGSGNLGPALAQPGMRVTSERSPPGPSSDVTPNKPLAGWNPAMSPGWWDRLLVKRGQ